MLFIVFDDDIGHDVVSIVASDLQAGVRIEGGYDFDGVLDFFEGSAGLFGDGGEAVHLEVFEMVLDEFDFQVAIAVEVVELDEEGFG